jgi:hypothetical protein
MVQHFCNQIIRHARFVQVNDRVRRQVEGRVRPVNVSLYDIFRHTRGDQLCHFAGRCAQMLCGIGGSLQGGWRLSSGIQRRDPRYRCQRHGRSQDNQMLAFHNSSKSLPQITFTCSGNQGRSEPSLITEPGCYLLDIHESRGSTRFPIGVATRRISAADWERRLCHAGFALMSPVPMRRFVSGRTDHNSK